MPLIHLRRPRTEQPQRLVGIDWSNPLTRGLQFLSCGGMPVNLVTGRLGARVGTVSTVVGPHGRGYFTDDGNNNRIDYLAQGIATPAEGTYGSIFYHDGTSVALQYLMLRGTNTTYYNIFCLDSAKLLSLFWGSIAQGNYTAGEAIEANTWTIASGSTPPYGASSGAKIFKNAARSALFASAAFALGWEADGNVYLNGRPSDTTRNLGGAQAVSVFWARVLTDAEHVAWHRNPWQLLRPEALDLWLPSSAPAPTSLAFPRAFPRPILNF